MSVTGHLLLVLPQINAVIGLVYFAFRNLFMDIGRTAFSGLVPL